MCDFINTDLRPSHGEKNISPFLIKTGRPRIGEDFLPGYYCEQQKMWMVETQDGAQPIINEQALSQLLTKTNQRTESDDDNWPIGHSKILQLVTKTANKQEVDDNFFASQMLALVTKTKAQQEADDDYPQAFGFHC